MNNVLEVKGLNKSYKDFSLSDVSFTLPEGCITGFIGINGAGKTTTIRTLLGLAHKASGTIKMFGKDMADNSRELRNRIGVVLDEGCFYNELTIAEMKSVIAPAYSNWSDNDFNGYIDRFSLNPRQKIASLSKGMRMKFAIALALSHRTELLIMDEPTSGLDPLLRSEFLEIMTDYMNQGGKGVLFSTHITSDLDKVADMLVMIHDGTILFQQDKDALLESHRLVKGDLKELCNENKKLFLRIQTTDFGFTGLTGKIAQVQQTMPDVLVERASIEDIMLANVKGGQRSC